MIWHEPALPRRERWAILGLRGATVWLTGLPASGKSTIAEELERALVAGGRPAYLLDGENVRHGLSGDLGFSAADRHEHARRVASVARMLADAGLVTVVALVSPAAADREAARQLHDEAGLDFVEAWVDTPIEECERRDPHGLYARARAGTLSGFTGVDAPYEPPENPDVRLRGAEETVEQSVQRVALSDAEAARPRPPPRRLSGRDPDREAQRPQPRGAQQRDRQRRPGIRRRVLRRRMDEPQPARHPVDAARSRSRSPRSRRAASARRPGRSLAEPLRAPPRAWRHVRGGAGRREQHVDAPAPARGPPRARPSSASRSRRRGSDGGS